jgi:hypothetical protein
MKTILITIFSIYLVANHAVLGYFIWGFFNQTSELNIFRINCPVLSTDTGNQSYSNMTAVPCPKVTPATPCIACPTVTPCPPPSPALSQSTSKTQCSSNQITACYPATTVQNSTVFPGSRIYMNADDKNWLFSVIP